MVLKENCCILFLLTYITQNMQHLDYENYNSVSFIFAEVFWTLLYGFFNDYVYGI